MIRTENLSNGDVDNNSLISRNRHPRIRKPLSMKMKICLVSLIACVASLANLIFILIQVFKPDANMGTIIGSTSITIFLVSMSISYTETSCYSNAVDALTINYQVNLP